MVFIGKTPPPVAYFSFTGFVFDRYDGEGKDRKRIFASIGDTINHHRINTLDKLPLPYSYYMFLRSAVLLSACVHLYFGVRHKRWIVVAIFASIAALFNPFKPVHFTKNIWVFLDMGAAALYALGYANLQRARAERAPGS